MTKKIYLETYKNCPGSLCFTLLFSARIERPLFFGTCFHSKRLISFFEIVAFPRITIYMKKLYFRITITSPRHQLQKMRKRVTGAFTRHVEG